ncbi:MAG: hypothetical protein L3J58_12030 [Emcibacter sp.]|nr:hypothetical protein [Emcibacter sp.]
MAYIIGLIVVGLFFLVLNYFTEFSRSQKITISAVFFAIIMMAILFNSYSENKDQHTLDIAMKFNQGKTIKCDGVDVNSSLYELSTGTYTFIGKENTPNYGKMISASICK